jgi:hypothetical protein
VIPLRQLLRYHTLVSNPNIIAVAGDVWVDYVGGRKPPDPKATSRRSSPIARGTDDNQTFPLAGGALLVEAFVRALLPLPDHVVHGPRFNLPDLRTDSSDKPILSSELIQQADRLTPKAMPRSILSFKSFAGGPHYKEQKRIRVDTRLGFVGSPPSGVESPASGGGANFVILDDSRRHFRTMQNHWPEEIRLTNDEPYVLHKLHGPPEEATESLLWESVHKNPRHVVIVCVDDLRRADRRITRGLSWERTALDIVWHLLTPDFSKLRNCSNLIVRLGIDGAVHWRCTSKTNGTYEASLIYDPSGIEGTAEQLYEGLMVGYGSAFVAALLKSVVAGGVEVDSLQTGIEAGLIAGRRLLASGFGDPKSEPSYPTNLTLFRDPDPNKGDAVKEGEYFARCEIPARFLTMGADPGYWRVLESVFVEKEAPLEVALRQVATGEEPRNIETLRDAPFAAFGAFRTYDRREVEQYRALYSLMSDYVAARHVERPLNVAVFGPPGAGKSFGVKEVASALQENARRDLEGTYEPRPITDLTFNLSQYKSPDELSAAFQQVRDFVLQDMVPLVFFDEFDANLDGEPLGWLRYFLGPMQDGKFMDRGSLHPIGRSIFVFAGGTAKTYEDFTTPMISSERDKRRFVKAKGPDFLSRLRAALDIHGLDLDPSFDAYGAVELFPCEPAIRLRRAGILAHHLGKKAPQLRNPDEKLRIGDSVLRAFLHVERFEHANRSFETLLESSHLNEEEWFFPSSLPFTDHTKLHTNATQFSQLLTEFDDWKADEFLSLNKMIEDNPVKMPRGIENVYRIRGRDIPRILRQAGCRRHKTAASQNGVDATFALYQSLEREHDWWVANKRREGFAKSERDDPIRLTHPWLVPWDELPASAQTVYSGQIFAIPKYLKELDYFITGPDPPIPNKRSQGRGKRR